MYGDGDPVQGALYHHAQCRLWNTGIQILADLLIFNGFSAPFFPPNQLESHPRMIPNLLPIGLAFCPIQILFFVTVVFVHSGSYHNGDMVGALTHTICTTMRCGEITTHGFATIYEAAFNIQVILCSIHSILLFPVVDGATQHLLYRTAADLLVKRRMFPALVDIQPRIRSITRRPYASLRCYWYGVVDQFCNSFLFLQLSVTRVSFKVAGW